VERSRAPFTIEKLEARREVRIAGGEFQFRIDRIDSIEGGGFAILDYKSGEPRSPRWNGETVRDPQLLAYLMAERGRNAGCERNERCDEKPAVRVHCGSPLIDVRAYS
jgi:RecB family exonuclease